MIHLGLNTRYKSWGLRSRPGAYHMHLNFPMRISSGCIEDVFSPTPRCVPHEPEFSEHSLSIHSLL